MNRVVSKNRTKNYIKQIKGSFLFKILAILISFLLIPIMIKYLGKEQYGIWSTLLSIVSWIVLFDIGIGNGLRNKISEALANDNRVEAANYISTAYVIIGLISLVLLSILLLICNFVPWQTVFNTTILTNDKLNTVVNITLVFLFLNFFLSLINQVFNGFQKTSLVIFNQFLSNGLSLMFIYSLYLYTTPSLIKLAFAYGSALIISSLVISVWFYSKNKDLIPIIKKSSKKYIKSISSLGFQFFIIQIAVIVIFTTDKILITQLFGPEYVTEYDIVFKLFSIITVMHGILMAPLWSAYSDAYHRKDFEWIKSALKKQLFVWFGLVIATIFLVFIAPYIIDTWIGKDFYNSSLIIAIALFVIVSTWNNVFGYLLGGLGYIRFGAYYTSFSAIINIPISYYYAVYLNYGVDGIVWGTVTSISLSAVLSPIQVYYFIFSKFKTEKYTRIFK